jgi:acid stress chaperone HdeB
MQARPYREIDLDQRRTRRMAPIWLYGLERYEDCMRAWSIAVGPLFAVLVSPAAQAQVTVDVAKITCRQYLLDRVISPKAPMIADWLSGYFHGKNNDTVLDIGAMAKNKDKVEDYCRMNLDKTVIDAAKTALDLGK